LLTETLKSKKVNNGNLPYNEESYLDRQAKAEIKKFSAICLSELQDWDRCRIVNEAIARRASSRKILSMASGQPYLNGVKAGY